MEVNHDDFGACVRASRMAQGLSQEKLAERVGITPTHIKHIESGHRKPSFEVLYNIAVILNLSVDKIFFPSKEKSDYPLLFNAQELLEKCDEKQLRILIATMKAMLSQ